MIRNLKNDPALKVDTDEITELRRQLAVVTLEAPLSPKHEALSEQLDAAVSASRRRVAKELHRRVYPLLIDRDAKVDEARAVQDALMEYVKVGSIATSEDELERRSSR